MATKHDDSCLQKAGESEPIFVLRAQDQLAPIVVRMWCVLARKAGTPAAKINDAYRAADQMDEWQGVHGGKRPD